MHTSNSHDSVVLAVVLACRIGDSQTVRELMSDGVIAVVDGEGEETGRENVSRLLVNAGTRTRSTSVSVESVNGRSGLAYRTGDRVLGIVAFSVAHGLVDHLWVILAPGKLLHWTTRSQISNPNSQEK